MSLNVYAAEKRKAIFEDLKAGRDPGEGEFDPALLKEGRTKQTPQVGTTRYEPDSITLEFIFPDPKGQTVILPVKLEVPERIVFLPVPEWVIETIWQGEIAGSYHFEGDARLLMEKLQSQLEPEANRGLFGPQAAKRRE